MATNTIKGSKIREIFGCACVPKPQPGDNEYLVEWEPSNIDALQYLGLWAFSDPSLAGITTLNILARSNSSAMIIGYASDLTTLNFPNLITLTSQLDNNSNLTTVNFPLLNISANADIEIYDNPSLTTITVSSILVSDYLYFYNNALNQTTVDNILQALVYSGVSDGYINMTGGTNAVPNATNVTILQNRGWGVYTN